MSLIFIQAILSGVLIGFSGLIYLLNMNFFGAIMFSTALVLIITFEIPLYTGKVGYIFINKEYLKLFITLIGNLFGALLVGLYVNYFKFNSIVENLSILLNNKQIFEINIYNILYWFCSSFGCGMLIYLAVEGYKKIRNYLIVVLSVASFILCGFNHCIADFFYIVAYCGNDITIYLSTFLYLGIIILGNSIGAVLLNKIK